MENDSTDNTNENDRTDNSKENDNDIV